MTDAPAERDLEDARLIEQGDYGRLLAKYLPAIRQRVRMDLDGPDAEDVVSQVVLHLYQALKRGKRYSAPFRSVAVRRAGWMVAEFISGKRLVPLDGEEEWGGSVEPQEPDDWPFVRTLLGELAPRDREVFERAVYRGLAPEEIAAELGMTRNAVDQAMYRARERLRKLLHD